MRVFYAIFLDDPDLRAAFDAIRLVCSPTEKLRTHITVRGPYRQRYPQRLRLVSETVRHSRIWISGTGCFFGGHQNTVFLEAHSEELTSVFRKPDYPKAIPHMTLYDGKEREFAEELYRCFKDVNIAFDFKTSGLVPVLSHSGQSNFDLRLSIQEMLVRQFTEIDLSLPALRELSDRARIATISNILRILIDRGLVKTSEKTSGWRSREVVK